VKYFSDATMAHLCQVTAPPRWPDLAGTRYELIEKIGQGGMGAVFLVRDRELDRSVALKVLNALPENTEAMARMMKEARIIACLEHPNIVPVHDCGVLPDGRFYYAMKLVRGKRLDEWMAGPAGLAERLQLFLKICDAVAFAHAHGVIHRDLKPQNVMLGSFGEVLVMDWGVAREVGDPRQHTNAAAVDRELGQEMGTKDGTIVGTPGYMAPEQAQGNIALIDGRADVHALGAILHFLLTGRAPIYERPVNEKGVSDASALVSPRRQDLAIPAPLEAVCLKALAAERDDRYAGVEELAGDLAHFLAGRRVRAYPEGFLETAMRLGTKYRTALALVMAYLIMRVLLLLFVRT
jgi:eukaryotic-like serine/threonine-protein kinase